MGTSGLAIAILCAGVPAHGGTGFEGEVAAGWKRAEANHPTARTGVDHGCIINAVGRTPPGSRIVDLAAGSGSTLKQVVPLFPNHRFVAVEVSREMAAGVTEGMSRDDAKRVTVLTPSSLSEFDLEGEPVALAFSIGALHHVHGAKARGHYDPEEVAIAVRVHRILQPGATYLIGEISPGTPTARWFEEVVANYRPGGHDGIGPEHWMDEAHIGTIAAVTGFNYRAHDVFGTWGGKTFETDDQAVQYMRDLFGLEIRDDALRRVLNRTLGGVDEEFVASDKPGFTGGVVNTLGASAVDPAQLDELLEVCGVRGRGAPFLAHDGWRLPWQLTFHYLTKPVAY